MSSMLACIAFSQLAPRHSPRPGVHCKPFFLQLHRRFAHPFLQLQKVSLRSSGAYERSVFKGIILPSMMIQPHFLGFTSLPFHSIAWVITLDEEVSVGDKRFTRDIFVRKDAVARSIVSLTFLSFV